MTYEGSSSQAEIHEEEIKPMLQAESVKILMDFVESRDDKDKFSPIYEVPSRLRDVNPSSFTPRVVSIGPMHKGRPNLKLMEDKKATYMYELLSELDSPNDETLKECLDKVMVSIKEIKRYYFGQNFDPDKYTDHEFARMMVIDACFILHFIKNLVTSDNIFSTNRLRSRYLAMDLVLLENQIPFFVLQHIYNLTLKTLESKPVDVTEPNLTNPDLLKEPKLTEADPTQPEPTKSDLTTMLHDLLERVNPFYGIIKKPKVENLSEHKHILGLLHECYEPQNSQVPEIKTLPTTHTAVEFHKVGLRFRPNPIMDELPDEKKNWLMDMKFERSSHKPTFRMPKVLIDHSFEVVLRNLIAYEQYSTPVKNYVTSYAMAMGMLAATPADIAKLAESGVITNHLGSNEKASNMISSICKDVTFHDFYYIDSWKKANNYYEGPLLKNFGVLKRKHFSTPWKAIALIAGVIVFLIAVVQFIIRMIIYASKHQI